MTKIHEFDRGFREGVRWAVTYALEEARRMNHPPAQAALRVLADRLGKNNPKRRPEAVERKS